MAGARPAAGYGLAPFFGIGRPLPPTERVTVLRRSVRDGTTAGAERAARSASHCVCSVRRARRADRRDHARTAREDGAAAAYLAARRRVARRVSHGARRVRSRQPRGVAARPEPARASESPGVIDAHWGDVPGGDGAELAALAGQRDVGDGRAGDTGVRAIQRTAGASRDGRPAMRRLPLLLFAVLMAARVAAAQQPETIEYYGQDVMGSIRIAWDANGNVIGRHDYLPFGKRLFTNAAMPKEGFGGQEKDAQTDEGYFHARMLQFRLGRFGSPDPVAVLENPQTLNRYSYATNNPEALVDPEGALASSGTECTWVEVEVEGGLSAQLNCPLKNSGGGGSSVLSDFFDFLAWAALHTVDTLVGTVGVDGGELSPTPSTAYKPSPAVETALDTALLVAAVITPVK